MCGFLGLISTPFRQSADQALTRLFSRGPDESRSLVIDDNIWIGHTRLSVIDLKDGHQPMQSHDDRLVLVFNGEIYNYKELKNQLQNLGWVFRTQSDTEVILVGHQQWGDRLPQKLDGMFAYAIWDRQEQRLYAARDKVGVKPFFYSTHKGFIFASTLAPFQDLADFPKNFDYEAIRDYLAYHVCLAPQSFYQYVRQLPPASWLTWSRDAGLSIGCYWQIPGPVTRTESFSETVDRVDAAFCESVRRQKVADVPLGAFLSGGIDSSLMVHYMQHTGLSKLKTFSLRFEQSGFDETEYAVSVAKHFGTIHQVIDAPVYSTAEFIQAVGSLDQPLSDPAYVMTYALSKHTRKEVTVAISGDGGDELFAGYGRYTVQETDFPFRIGLNAFRRAVLRGWLPGSLLRRSLWGQERMLYRQVDVGPWTVSRKSLKAILNPEAYRASSPDRALERWVSLVTSWGGVMNTDALMRADLWTYLSENCLAKTDRASMAHGLEVRVPMLGQSVLDAVLTMPSSIHYQSGAGKAVLRELSRRYLPLTAWNRPKHGFSVPVRNLMQTVWRDLGDDLISRSQTLAPWLNPESTMRLWKGSRKGRGYPALMYSILVLLLWLDLRKT